MFENSSEEKVKPKAGIVTDKEELWTIYSFEGLLYIFPPNSK